jgi:hypothetical protein
MLEWDAADRLSIVKLSGMAIATFAYDASGNRVMREEGGETVVYVCRYYEKNISTGVETVSYYLGTRGWPSRRTATTATCTRTTWRATPVWPLGVLNWKSRPSRRMEEAR